MSYHQIAPSLPRESNLSQKTLLLLRIQAQELVVLMILDSEGGNLLRLLFIARMWQRLRPRSPSLLKKSLSGKG